MHLDCYINYSHTLVNMQSLRCWGCLTLYPYISQSHSWGLPILIVRSKTGLPWFYWWINFLKWGGKKEAQTANTTSCSQTKHSGFNERYLKSHLILYSYVWKYWLWLCVVQSTETSNLAENVIWKVMSGQILNYYVSTPCESLLLWFYHKLQIEWIFKNSLIFLLQTTLKTVSLRVSGSGTNKKIWIVFPLTTAIPIFVKSPTMLRFGFFALIETCLCILPK